MADWTNLPNTAVGVGGLPSGTTVTALRDNPVAIAEGAAGAPRVQTLGQSLSRIATFSGTGLSITEIDFIDLPVVREFFIAFESLAFSGSATSFNVAVSSDNGSTFSAFLQIASFGFSSPIADFITPPALQADWGRLVGDFGGISAASNINAIRFRVGTGNTITAASNLNVYAKYRSITT
jgi:hypothetical protein